MAARHFILGTAGHVDHGKTELVKALTGWDTDRLKEEKLRGISIELGFAPLILDEETFIGIIDVPGHERFVKNMVAGAGGIDMAILLVAADEGVMPQTKEHLEVLRSLAIPKGVVVISKADLAGDDMLELLAEEVTELVSGTFLENAPVVLTSARSGQGIDDLKDTLKKLSGEVAERSADGPFRLAVDRVFLKEGIGVVVTGSCYSGSVAVGDVLEILPSKKRVRVRAIQSFQSQRERGRAGERLAIALQGVKLGAVVRGDMVVTPSKFLSSQRIDARLQLGKYADIELKQRERVRLHHGAKEVLGRVVLLETDRLRSGEDSLVQLRLEKPIVAAEADHFVLRKYSPARVIGGGKVIRVDAERHRPLDEGVLQDLRLREHGAPEEKVRSVVAAAGVSGVSVAEMEDDGVKSLLDDGEVVEIEGRLFHRDILEKLAADVEALALEYINANPLRYGIDKEELKQKVHFPHSTQIFNRVLERLAAIKPIYIKDNRVRSGSEAMELSPRLREQLNSVEDGIRKAGLLFPRYSDIERRWSGGAGLLDALQLLRERGVIVKVGEDGYLHHEPFEGCLRTLARWFETHSAITVGDFKDLFGMTRKHAIPLLEYLDSAKLTVRKGDTRLPGARLAAWRPGRSAAGRRDPGSAGTKNDKTGF